MAEFPTKKHIAVALSTAKASRPKLLLDLLWQTSCSISEATQLRSQDVAQAKVRIGSRVVSVSKELTDALKTDQEFVFASRQGGPISVRRAQQLLRDITPFSAQDIRTASIKEKSATHSTKQLRDITGLGSQRLGQILPPKSTVEKTTETPTTRDELLVATVAQTAATIEEIRQLQKVHVATDSLQIAGRQVPVTKELAAALKRLETDYLFQGISGPLSMPASHLAWKKATDKTVQEVRETRIALWHSTHTKEKIAEFTGLSVERIGQVISERRDAI